MVYTSYSIVILMSRKKEETNVLFFYLDVYFICAFAAIGKPFNFRSLYFEFN